MRRSVTALTAAALLVLAGCAAADDAAPPAHTAAGSSEPASGDAAELLAAHGLAGMDATAVVDHLDRLPRAERPTDLMASVRVDELMLADPTGEVALDLPEDAFYLSFAPYVEGTHECFYHSLTTCTGELGGTAVDVTITDDAGTVLVEESTTTYDNGFVGFWLPRDIAGTVEVSYDGLTGSVPFTTDDDGATCLTTLRLT